MAVNKVLFGTVPIMDITDRTVTPETLAKGVTAYAANGEKITGTMEATDDVFVKANAFTYTVESVSGASYGFVKNAAGYWESENKGVNSSYAICRVRFEVAAACDITFDVINYAETKYDYGMLGLLDTALDLSFNPDSDSELQKNFYNLQSADIVPVVYENVPAGSHFVDVKFRKDSSMAKNNDSIQFKVQAAPLVEVVAEDAFPRIQAAESDLVPENIRSGVEILGVTGTLSEGVHVEFTDVTVNAPNAYDLYYLAQSSDGDVVPGYMTQVANATFKCLKNSLFHVNTYFVSATVSGGEMVCHSDMDAVFRLYNVDAATITLSL